MGPRGQRLKSSRLKSLEKFNFKCSQFVSRTILVKKLKTFFGEKLGKCELLMRPLCQPPKFWCFWPCWFCPVPQLTDAFPTAFNSRKTCPELPNSFQSEHLFLSKITWIFECCQTKCLLFIHFDVKIWPS